MPRKKSTLKRPGPTNHRRQIMSSLDFANALFSKYQHAAASCSALLFTDSPTSPCPSFPSVAPVASSSCALVSSGYHLHVSGGRGSRGLPVPPSSSFSSPSSSSFPSTSSSSTLCSSLSGLNRNSGSIQPGAHPFDPAEVLSGGACSALGAGPMCSSLERFTSRPQLNSLSARLPEPACRRQTNPEQLQLQTHEEGLRIYPWMRSSGEEL